MSECGACKKAYTIFTSTICVYVGVCVCACGCVHVYACGCISAPVSRKASLWSIALQLPSTAQTNVVIIMMSTKSMM